MTTDKKPFDINTRRIIDGPTNNLMMVNPVKHAWALDIWKVMMANTWFPEDVDLSRDIKQYRSNELTDGERLAYDRALAFLSNLDGIQFNNLTLNIGRYITSPEVGLTISRQAWEEALHVMSYSTLIEAITGEPRRIYEMYQTDDVLASKNAYIMRQSDILGTDYSPRNFALAAIANLLLEGVYFFSGFLVFYTLARGGKMLGSADMIRYIQRDEQGTHLMLFAFILKAMFSENPEIFDDAFWKEVTELVDIAVELESSWGAHMIEGGVLGLTPGIFRDYAKHRANQSLALIGRPKQYDVKDPVPWVVNFSQPNQTETNFFEGKPVGYQVGGQLQW